LILLVGYFLFSFIKLYRNRNKLKEEGFKKEYGFLVEGQKVERLYKKGD
jgi:hypothetical protein